MATPPPASRELSSWERQLFAGVRMVEPDEVTPPRELLPYDGPLPQSSGPRVIRYYGSIFQPDLLSHLAAPLSKET